MAPKQKVRSTSKRKSQNKLWIAITLIALLVISVGVYLALANQAPTTISPTQVLLHTDAGDITIDLRTDKPITSSNFIALVEDGKYDGTTFYRTMSGFMIQGGKVNGNVAAIKDEIGSNNRNLNYTIAMAKTNQPNSATSEFFINVADNGQFPNFDSTYTVFGTVIAGKDVVDAIANAPVTENPNMPGEMSNPVNPVTIIKASIVS